MGPLRYKTLFDIFDENGRVHSATSGKEGTSMLTEKMTRLLAFVHAEPTILLRDFPGDAWLDIIVDVICTLANEGNGMAAATWPGNLYLSFEADDNAERLQKLLDSHRAVLSKYLAPYARLTERDVPVTTARVEVERFCVAQMLMTVH